MLSDPGVGLLKGKLWDFFMGKFFLFLPVLLLWFALLTPPAAAADSLMVAPNAGISAQPRQIGSRLEPDERVFRLYKFLKKRHSPLALYASDLVAQADYYRLDWRLLPAISGLESQFGRLMIPGTFNAYGYGGGRWHFANWPDSISKMSRYLANRYYAQGLIKPWQIAPIYAPPCQYWGRSVSQIMGNLGRR